MIHPANLEALTSTDLRGTAPMICVTAGIVLALLAEIAPALRPARGLAFVGSLLAAIAFELRLVADPAGEVFHGAFAASSRSATWGVLFCCAALIAWTYGRRYYKEEAGHVAEHDLLMLCSTLGMMLMAGSRDLITFFVGLELLSVPLYSLAAFRRVRATSVEAGLRYFVLGAFAAGLFLYGSALVYAATGTVSLAGLHDASLGSPLALVGAALIAASLFFKVSVFPFHFWVPDVYQGSPTPVTTFMATGTKAAGFAFLLEVAFVMPPSSAGLIAAIAVVTMALGNLGALVQSDLKRLFAYSAVAHAGTLLLVVAASLAGDPRAAGPVDAALYYMAAYVFTAGGAFGLVALLEADGERFTKLESLRGLGRRRPGISAALSLFMLSLGGFPATGGFLGKYFVFSSTLRADLVWASVIGVLLSVVALGYYLRVILTLWMLPEPEGERAPEVRRLSATLVTGVCAAMVLWLGLFPGWFLERFLN
ncbi:MAG: NADH-quinone oxidoreductase subunit N [Planctomycetes bacterium]|nr:NADH-quinone oxidoreductase subunit N [Planctomycetota bacterium]